MSESAVPFPWWSWLLIGLWAGSIALHCRQLTNDATSARAPGMPVLPILICVYTALIAYLMAVATSGGDWPAQRLLFWCLSAVVLCGAVVVVTTASPRASAWGMLAAWWGSAGIALELHAEELAALCAAVGTARYFWGTSESDATALTMTNVSAVPRRDDWLAIAAATALGVLVLGTVQYAVRVEAHRPGASRWYTAIPSIEQLRRWKALEDNGDAAVPGLDPRWLVFAGIVGVAYWTGQSRRVRETTALASDE